MIGPPSLPQRQATNIRATVILLVLALSLSGASSLEATRPDFFADIGVVIPPTSSTRKPYCLESTARWTFHVVLRNLPDMPFNAEGAVITVNGSDGRTWSNTAGPGGQATIEWPMQTEGPLNLTVSAQMGNSTSPTEKFTVEVVPCYWEFSIFLEEEYDLSKDESLTVGAKATAYGRLRRREESSDAPASSGRLELTGGAGSFNLFATDTLEPLDAYLDPEVQGSTDLKLDEANAGGGQVTVKLIGTASGLPGMANLGFKDVTEQKNEIYVTAPVPTSASIPSNRDGGGFDPIERMQLGSITLPDSGGTMETNPDMVFIQSSDRIKSSARFTLFRAREPQNW
jgi:hypothetical protein